MINALVHLKEHLTKVPTEIPKRMWMEHYFVNLLVQKLFSLALDHPRVILSQHWMELPTTTQMVRDWGNSSVRLSEFRFESLLVGQKLYLLV